MHTSLFSHKRPRSKVRLEDDDNLYEYDDSFWRFPIIYPNSPRKKKKRMFDSDSY